VALIGSDRVKVLLCFIAFPFGKVSQQFFIFYSIYTDAEFLSYTGRIRKYQDGFCVRVLAGVAPVLWFWSGNFSFGVQMGH